MSIKPLLQSQSNLQYQLKLNQMIVVLTNKQTLISCIANMLGMDNNKLHNIICQNLQKCIQQNILPRKLYYIDKDISILQDYRKYPQLVNFIKITLQMISVIFQTKITVYYLNNYHVLTAFIVNQKGYQSEIKIARIANLFYQIKQSFNSCTNFSLPKIDIANTSHSFKFYKAFDVQPLRKKQQPQQPQPQLQLPQLPQQPPALQEQEDNNHHVRSFSYLHDTPLTKKSVSMFQKCFEDQSHISLTNVPINPDKIVTPIILIPDLVIEDQHIHLDPVPEQIKTNIDSLIASPNTILEETTAIHVDQSGNGENNMFYNYYTQQMYYPYIMNQGGVRGEVYPGFNQPSPSLSPGKNPMRRQNSTLQIKENQRYTGRLKFFDEGKNYGFIIMDADQSDIFVHCDDLQKAGIIKDRVRSYKQSQGLIRFSFKVMSYFGKYKQSRKAVQLTILDDGLGMQQSLFT